MSSVNWTQGTQTGTLPFTERPLDGITALLLTTESSTSKPEAVLVGVNSIHDAIDSTAAPPDCPSIDKSHCLFQELPSRGSSIVQCESNHLRSGSELSHNSRAAGPFFHPLHAPSRTHDTHEGDVLCSIQPSRAICTREVSTDLIPSHALPGSFRNPRAHSKGVIKHSAIPLEGLPHHPITLATNSALTAPHPFAQTPELTLEEAPFRRRGHEGHPNSTQSRRSGWESPDSPVNPSLVTSTLDRTAIPSETLGYQRAADVFFGVAQSNNRLMEDAMEMGVLGNQGEPGVDSDDSIVGFDPRVFGPRTKRIVSTLILVLMLFGATIKLAQGIRSSTQ